MISKKKQLTTLVVWLLIVPPGFYLAFNYLPSKEISWVNIILYFALLIITMLMHLELPNMTVSLERWITFTVFLQYGIFAELVITQLAMVIILFGGKNSLPTLHRFLVNSVMFTIVSIVSGLVYHFAGGEVGMLAFSSVAIYAFLYAVTYMALNSIIMKIYFVWIARSVPIWDKGTLWDYIITMIVLLVSLSLYYLDVYLGNKSILLIGIPFLLILWVVQMYHRSDDLHDKLSSASVIGHELADRLSFEDVIRTFIMKLRDVVFYDHAYVLEVRTGQRLDLLMGSEKGVISKDTKGLVIKSKTILGDGLDLYRPKVFGTKKELDMLEHFEFLYPVESAIIAPIKGNQRTEGFLILTSRQKNVFRALEMKIVDILTGYFGISLEKARLFEKTVEQSERCGLTNLHNFRYLNENLDADIIRYHTGEIDSLSAIILDIDHFKSMNDTYGHQSGNDLLCMLATILQKYVPGNGILARYGGEEFVFILPNHSKNETVELAEKIRKEVASAMFQIMPDLSGNRKLTDVHMTISVGVASVPEDAEDAKMLLRNADRALYIGGKQAGRNRVGVFSDKEIVTV